MCNISFTPLSETNFSMNNSDVKKLLGVFALLAMIALNRPIIKWKMASTSRPYYRRTYFLLSTNVYEKKWFVFDKYRTGLTDQMQQEWMHACSHLIIQNIFQSVHIWCLQQNLTSSTSSRAIPLSWKESDMSDIIEGAC